MAAIAGIISDLHSNDPSKNLRIPIVWIDEDACTGIQVNTNYLFTGTALVAIPRSSSHNIMTSNLIRNRRLRKDLPIHYQRENRATLKWMYPNVEDDYDYEEGEDDESQREKTC